MKARRRSGSLAAFLAVCLMLTLVTVPAAAAGSNNFSSYTYSRQYVVEHGIMKGDGNGNYFFNDNVKRGDCILLIVRTFEFPTYSGFPAFKDVPEDSYYRDAIATMRAIGVARGDGTNFFPERNITLEEGFLLVTRSLELADARLKSPAATEAGLRALFGTRSVLDTATRDDIAAMLYYARTGNAPDVPYKTPGSTAISYSTQSGKAVSFNAADFTAAASGQVPAYVKFTLPSSVVGRLYYRYGTAASEAVTAATAYYLSGTPDVSRVSFLPATGFVGTVTLLYTAFDAKGNQLYTGEIKINVTRAQATGEETIRYSTKNGAPVTFKAEDFRAVATLMSVDVLSFVRFTPPAPNQGTLTYFDGTTTRAVTSTTLLYTARTPYLSYVTFTPAADFSGTVEISYTAYNTYNDLMYTASVVIEVSASVNASGEILLKGQKNTPVKLDTAAFVDAAMALKGGGIDRVQFLLPTSTFGKLYYRYGTTGETAVSASTNYYIGRAPYLSDVSLVPAKDYTGTFKVAYRAFNSAGTQLYIGYINFEISDSTPAQTGTDAITYTVQREGVVTFNASDFTNACAYLTGERLGFVRFTLPPTSAGRLYYRYGQSGEALVKETDAYYASGTPGISSVSFAATWDAPDIITIPYRAYSTSGGLLYTGAVTVRVGTQAQAKTLRYTVTADSYVTFSANSFKNVAVSEYNGKKLAAPASVQFELPPVTSGVLYAYYKSASQTPVSSATKYALSGSPSVSNVSFVPSRSFTGTAEIRYYAYSSAGELLYTGLISVQVTQPSGGGNVTGSTIYYSVDAGEAVWFNSYDFAAAGIYLVGEQPSYIRFYQLPSTLSGRLYYRYGMSGQALVQTSTNYYLDDALYLSDVSFVAASSASGTVTVQYRAYDAFGDLLYVGTVEITIYPQEVYAPEIGPLFYTMRRTETFNIPGGDLILAVYEWNPYANLSYVKFTPPASTQGLLVYGASATSANTPVVSVMSFYVSGTPSLGNVYFRPATNYTGPVVIPYTAYGTDNQIICSGTIEIYVTA